MIRSLENPIRLYLHWSSRLLALIAGAMFCIMLAVNAYNIAIRSLTAQGLVWHQEVSIMAAFWIYFAAYALLAKERKYITVDFIFDRIGKQIAYIMQCIIVILTLAFHLYLFMLCIEVMESAGFLETPILGWSEQVYVVPLLVGSADIVITELLLGVLLFGIGDDAVSDVTLNHNAR
ncbi:MAG: TRAP transporter small permease subunit [Rhizobiaceae bacterium]